MSQIHVYSSSTFKIRVHATAVQYYLWYAFFYYLVILRSSKEHILQGKNMNKPLCNMERGETASFNSRYMNYATASERIKLKDLAELWQIKHCFCFLRRVSEEVDDSIKYYALFIYPSSDNNQ